MRVSSRTGLLLSLFPIVVVGIWLYWPTLHLGLYADDYVAAAILDDAFAAPRAPLDLFNFASGEPEDVRALKRQGSLPWWAPPDFRIAFLRPLSSAMWLFDRAVFGQQLWAYHVHSWVAWMLVMLTAALFYRRYFPGWVWIVATAIFAFDDSQHFPVMWLSNRGALYATACGLLALYSYARFREDGATRWGFGCALFTSAGLLFGEWGFPVLAFILAFELVLGQGRVTRRLMSLSVAMVPAVVFLLVRGVMGYGVHGSGAYVDPMADPVRFSAVLANRIPVFAADMLWNIPAAWWDHGSPWRDAILRWNAIPPRIWRALPGWRLWHVVLGVAALAVMGGLLWWAWRRLCSRERIAFRFLLLGAFLSLIPVAGSFASTRLTLAAFFGVAPVLTVIARELGRALFRYAPAYPWRFALSYALMVSLVYFQLLAPLSTDFSALVANYRACNAWALQAELDETRIHKQRVFLLSANEFTSTFYFSYIRHFHGRRLPLSYQPISAAPYAMRVTRESSHSLLLQTLGGGFATSGVESMFRPRRQPLRSGIRVELQGATLEVAHVVDGRANRLRLRFDKPVDHPEHVFLVSSELGLTRFSPPELGQSQRMPRPMSPDWTAVRRGRYERRLGGMPTFLKFDPVPEFIEYDP